MIRSHGMSTGALGTWLALIIGLGGAISVFGGGLLADKLGPRGKRWYVNEQTRKPERSMPPWETIRSVW